MRGLPDGSLAIGGPLDDPQYRTKRKQEFLAALLAKVREQYSDQLTEFLDALPRLLHKHPEFSDEENEEIYLAVKAALEEGGLYDHQTSDGV